MRTKQIVRFDAGFTLLEALIALVIAAVAAGVILSFVRSLMLRSEKEQAHQYAVLQLMNDSLRISHGVIRAKPLTKLEKNKLLIDLTDRPWANMDTVQVDNFSARGEPIPPLEFAYTPFQLFSSGRDRYRLHIISPSLNPPAGSSLSSYIPTVIPAVTPPPENSINKPSENIQSQKDNPAIPSQTQVLTTPMPAPTAP